LKAGFIVNFSVVARD